MEIKEIQKQFNKVIAYSQDIAEPKTDDLFEKWLEAKRDFIEVFNGNLIYEYPEKITFMLSEHDKNKKILKFTNYIEDYYCNKELADFIYENKDGFFDNTVIKGQHKGMRLMKAFKFYIDDKEILNEIQQKASMIIQDNCVSGTLCLSVHPLDFLSTSENTHKWRSCHALDGEYRAGNLAYMTDNSTVICYLRSDKKAILPNFPEDVSWNDKKWRMLLFLSDSWDLIFAGRQYPFEANSALDIVKDKLFSKVGFGDFSDWCNKLITEYKDNDVIIDLHNRYMGISHSLKPIHKVVIEENYNRAIYYNDVLHSSFYNPSWTYKIKKYNGISFQISDEILTSYDTKVHIGNNDVKCLCCGKNYIDSSDRMTCEDCFDDDDAIYCDCCGRRIHNEEEEIWLSDGSVVCEDCFADECFVCPVCGETHWNADGIYSNKYQETVCRWCYDDIDDDVTDKYEENGVKESDF